MGPASPVIVAFSVQLACHVVLMPVSFLRGDVPCRRLTWESATQRLLQAATIKAEEWPSTAEKVADMGNVSLWSCICSGIWTCFHRSTLLDTAMAHSDTGAHVLQQAFGTSTGRLLGSRLSAG